MPEYMSDEMSENMSDRMPDRLPDRMPGGMSGYMPDRMPEYMPEYMSDRMSEYTKYMSKYTSWHVMVGITRSRVIFFIDPSTSWLKIIQNPSKSNGLKLKSHVPSVWSRLHTSWGEICYAQIPMVWTTAFCSMCDSAARSPCLWNRPNQKVTS